MGWRSGSQGEWRAVRQTMHGAHPLPGCVSRTASSSRLDKILRLMNLAGLWDRIATTAHTVEGARWQDLCTGRSRG
jgi:hypothetical protein